MQNRWAASSTLAVNKPFNLLNFRHPVCQMLLDMRKVLYMLAAKSKEGC